MILMQVHERCDGVSVVEAARSLPASLSAKRLTVMHNSTDTLLGLEWNTGRPVHTFVDYVWGVLVKHSSTRLDASRAVLEQLWSWTSAGMAIAVARSHHAVPSDSRRLLRNAARTAWSHLLVRRAKIDTFRRTRRARALPPDLVEHIVSLC